MPTKLTKQELNKIQYVSMSDYYKNVNQYNTIEDKMKYTTRYLLNHKGHEDYSLVEAIHIARQAIGNSLEKSNEKDNLEANMFVANPIEYIRKEAVKLASYQESQEITKEMIDRLDKTSKAKTIFALNLLNSVKDQQEIDRNYT